LVGPWVAKENPPVFLDSEDEADLEEAAWCELKRRKDYYTSPEQWREIGEFFLHQMGALMGAIYPGDEICLMDEILGEFDGEEEDRGKNSISEQLRVIHDNADRVHELEDEVEELKERLERERKRNNDLTTTNEGLIEDRRNTIAVDNYERLANYLASAIGCSRGRPVGTLIGAAKDHLEKLESRVREDPRVKNLQSETKRKVEKLRKLDDEKKERDQVIFSLRRELRQMEEASAPAVESVEKAEVVEVGIQASPDMVDASTERREDALVEASGEKKERKRMEEKKRTEKGKERAKDSGLEKQEDEVMLDTGRFSPYEDLSEYEKEIEDVALVTPPITKKQTTRPQVERPAGRPQPTKYKRTKAADPEYVDTAAFVVHGIPCQRPMADTIQDIKKTGMRGIIGARWLVGGQRRAGKTTSSVVTFLNRVISFHVQEGQMQAKVRGRSLPVSIYDFERGRKRPEESDW